MAVGGGATGAFYCVVQANELVIRGTTTLRSECLAVAAAVEKLGRGEQWWCRPAR